MNNKNVHQVMDPRTGKVITIRRNDPCMCGSGQKFKNCHLPEMMSQEQAMEAQAEKQGKDLLSAIMANGVIVKTHTFLMQVSEGIKVRLKEGKNPIADPKGSAQEGDVSAA